MGLEVTVFKAGKEEPEIYLNQESVIEVSFLYDVYDCLYAKGAIDTRIVKIRGNITALVDQTPETLNFIRVWAKQKFTGNTEQYYKKISFQYTHAGIMVRKVILRNAFVKSYAETIDAASGDGVFEMELEQKANLREKITVLPESIFGFYNGKEER